MEEDLLRPSLWRRLKNCSAAFCYNDSLALMLMDHLNHKGILVPDDFSVVEVDNIFMANTSNLTSLVHPSEKLGKKAAELIISMIHGDKGHNILFPPLLVPQNSVKNLNDE